MHRSLSSSLCPSQRHIFCMLTVPLYLSQSFSLLRTMQVIYKKFNIPCPFVDFAINSTASVLNISVTDPGGNDNPACIPKMANLNSQVGFFLHVTHPESAKMHLHCHDHGEPPAYVTVIYSMRPVTVHDPSMEITLGLKHSTALRAFIKLLMRHNKVRLTQGSEMDGYA